jgi:hypothetical protein
MTLRERIEKLDEIGKRVEIVRRKHGGLLARMELQRLLRRMHK